LTRIDFQYRRPARVAHWTVAVLVIAMIAADILMIRPDLNPSVQNGLFLFHKNVGLGLLILVILRISYRWRHPPAALPDDLPGWQRLAAGLSHASLYGLLLAMPVAGYIRVKAGGFPIETLDALGAPSLVPRSDALAETAKTIHYFAGIALGAVIAVHIAAAAYHGIARRDGVFSRMWPPFAGRGG